MPDSIWRSLQTSRSSRHPKKCELFRNYGIKEVSNSTITCLGKDASFCGETSLKRQLLFWDPDSKGNMNTAASHSLLLLRAILHACSSGIEWEADCRLFNWIMLQFPSLRANHRQANWWSFYFYLCFLFFYITTWTLCTLHFPFTAQYTCCAIICDVELSCVMLCSFVVCFAVLCYNMLCYVVPHHGHSLHT